MIVPLISSIIAFQPGTRQQRTRRGVEQNPFDRFGRAPGRVQSSLGGTRSLCRLGGPPPRCVAGKGRPAPGEGH